MAGEGNPTGYAIVPSSAAGGAITGTGTNNTIAKFTGTNTIGDSAVTDNGTVVTVSTNIIDSGLTASQIVTSNGSKQLISGGAGTTTTVLHGNAGGAPSYSAVSLTADVSGILPVANGGNGFAPGTPTVASTGIGSTGTATVTAGNERMFTITMTPGGTGITNAGAVTVTLSQTLASAAGCFVMRQNGTGSWDQGLSLRSVSTSTTAPVFGWSNNGVSLTSGQTYLFIVQIVAPT